MRVLKCIGGDGMVWSEVESVSGVERGVGLGEWSGVVREKIRHAGWVV